MITLVGAFVITLLLWTYITVYKQWVSVSIRFAPPSDVCYDFSAGITIQISRRPPGHLAPGTLGRLIWPPEGMNRRDVITEGGR